VGEKKGPPVGPGGTVSDEYFWLRRPDLNTGRGEKGMRIENRRGRENVGLWFLFKELIAI